MAWGTPKTDWASSDGVAYGDINRIEENIRILSQYGGPFGTTTGTSTAYVVTASPPLTSLVDGSLVVINSHVANTGASTINVNGLGVKSILNSKGDALIAGKLALDGVHTLRYNGTAFILQGEGGDYGTAVAADVLAGKTIGTNAGVISGTMTDKSGVQTADAIASMGSGTLRLGIPGTGYYTDGGALEYTDADFIASNIKSDVSIFGLTGTYEPRAGYNWTSRTSAADDNWLAVAYGAGMFVAVAGSTDGTVMTSPDGITWTLRTSAADNNWCGIAYGGGTFVAVSSSGTIGTKVMTSPDGITWTARAVPVSLQWLAVAYGAGLFVAVSISGSGNRVMTSPDGITWTSRTSAADNSWRSVVYGTGMFVAVSGEGTVMTSTDGITWTLRTSAAASFWTGIAYGGGTFVVVGSSADVNARVMTSPDGITWTARTSATSHNWSDVAYGAGLFVATTNIGTGDRVMTSPDGITWTARTSTADIAWTSVAYGAGMFVAVSTTGTGNRVMTSSYG